MGSRGFGPQEIGSAQEVGVHIGQRRGPVPRLLEILAGAVDHGGDAGAVLQAADIDGDAGIGGVLDHIGAGDFVQQAGGPAGTGAADPLGADLLGRDRGQRVRRRQA